MPHDVHLKEAMDSLALREQTCGDLLGLPEDAFRVVREFVLFQKKRNGASNVRRGKNTASAGKSAALEKLMRFKGTLSREIDISMELGEALDEKCKRFV